MVCIFWTTFYAKKKKPVDYRVYKDCKVSLSLFRKEKIKVCSFKIWSKKCSLNFKRAKCNKKWSLTTFYIKIVRLLLFFLRKKKDSNHIIFCFSSLFSQICSCHLCTTNLLFFLNDISTGRFWFTCVTSLKKPYFIH